MTKKNIPLLIVIGFMALIFVAMFAVAMIDKWGFGVFAWLAVGAIDAFLLKKLLKKKVVAPKTPTPAVK